MTTVTKLKSEVSNKNLPILLPDGSVSNYYYGRFVNILEDKGYTLSSEEKTAISNFINSGINSWISYVYYLTPFIGNNDYPNAGIVPLIDNIDDYKMEEYSEESYADIFEYDLSGKIKSLHSTDQNLALKSPLNYTKDRGAIVISSIKYITPSSGFGNYLFRSENDILEDTKYYYSRARYQKFSNRDSIALMCSSDISAEVSALVTPISYSVSNNTAVTTWVGNFKNETDDILLRRGYNYNNSKVDNTNITTAITYGDRNYGKYNFCNYTKDVFVNCFAFVSPYIPTELIYKLSDDINTLVMALGRV